MGSEPRCRLAELLGAVSGRGAFSARHSADPADLRVEVTGVGPLRLPVSAAQARQLRVVARPARYGLGEQTLTDPRVRDTWEVPKSRVRIDQRQWKRTLAPVLDRLRAGLGLPEGCALKAELHAMLLYEPGQFFVPHQDSEKSDAMVGTLSVLLPGAARGGTLVVQHGESTATYRGSDRRLTFVAFYADCRHEIRPVTSGHRVVLTYNLLLAGEPATAPAPGTEVVTELTACLAEHFEQENRLVYLLDHQYTARGLGWSRLKGVDATRVAALRVAAEAADCELVLALADLHETWDCLEQREERYWYDHGDGDDDDDDDEQPDDEGYELGELLDRSTALDTWVDVSGSPAQPVATTIEGSELCATTPSATLTPYESQYEGYMGNYGNTMDRWYRRGAVVVWPRALDFAVRSQASPGWALDTLAALLRDGEVAGARERVGSLAPFWSDTVRAASSTWGESAPTAGLLGPALPVALGLDDPALATLLLHPFHVELLTPTDAARLLALAERYGAGWARELLAAWDGGWRGPYSVGRDRSGWIAALPGLCAALAGSGVAQFVLALSWDWLHQALRYARSVPGPSSRAQALAELAAPVAGLLRGADVAGGVESIDAALTVLCSSDEALVRFGVQVLRAMSEGEGTGAGFEPLARHCRERLAARLSRPSRDPQDWSVDLPGTCACELCAKLAADLADPALRTWDWPLAEPKRRHVHDRIDRNELPVQHQTRRQGRPYTLVLAKTSALFERETQARRDDEADLWWLARIA